MLPNEAENKDLIEKEFGRYLVRAHAVLNAGLLLHEEISKRRMNAATLTVGVLVQQSLYRFRMIIAAWELGDLASADILTRTLWEMGLTIRFIVSPKRSKAAVARFSDQLRADVNRWPALPKGRSPTDFRAELYHAADVIYAVERAKKLEEHPGAKRLGREGTGKLAGEMAAVVAELGSDWVERIRKTKSFTCIRGVKNLAEYCGGNKAFYYLTGYSHQSTQAHGGGAMSLFGGPPVHDLHIRIRLASAVYLETLRTVDRRLRLAKAAELDAVFEQVKRIPLD